MSTTDRTSDRQPQNGEHDVAATQPVTPELLAALHEIQQRVLWLATRIIHHANHVRPNPDGSKVGGHQASSASVVSILTALYFHFLEPGDRVAVKPHASPVFHAIQYLMGQLPREYLTTLRSYGGLQAYPSRTKDPDHVDFSTGSVGLGAIAPAFAAVAHRYTSSHFDSVTSRRFIAIIGDAELDEGSVWEAILDEALSGLGNLLWIVDLNRQSLDRVIPGVRAARLKRIFSENNWQVLEAKYGRKLESLFSQPGGSVLRERIDTMSNEEYQALIRLPGAELRARLIQHEGGESAAIASIIHSVPDEELPATLANLGGHDLEELLAVLGHANSEQQRPTVVFAYTIKGWGLPIAGNPLNHSMLLSNEQMDALRAELGIAADNEWDSLDPTTPGGQLCALAARRLYSPTTVQPAVLPASTIPQHLGLTFPGVTSTQEGFGRVLGALADRPELRPRLVTTSPDVSVSTNLAGWINKTGVFTPQTETDYEAGTQRLLRWERGPHGQHIELGISEMNLFMLLGMLGLSAELCGQHLLPIGTVYDPFVCRGLDAFIYGIYSGAKFIIAGTPSGITLAPEGGAHQSTVTPSLGIELPGVHAYEPCFAREVEWILLEGLRECCDRAHGRSTYLRLSTKPIDQALLTPALERLGEVELRRQVLAGGYRLIDWRDADVEDGAAHVVQIAAVGAMLPEAVEAARYLHSEGVGANVLHVTSPRRLFEAWQAAPHHPNAALDWLLPRAERQAPIITVHDAAAHALSWLGGVHGARVTALGVNNWGQSGTRADLYRHYGIGTEAIVQAAFAAADEAL